MDEGEFQRILDTEAELLKVFKAQHQDIFSFSLEAHDVLRSFVCFPVLFLRDPHHELRSKAYLALASQPPMLHHHMLLCAIRRRSRIAVACARMLYENLELLSLVIMLDEEPRLKKVIDNERIDMQPADRLRLFSGSDDLAKTAVGFKDDLHEFVHIRSFHASYNSYFNDHGLRVAYDDSCLNDTEWRYVVFSAGEVLVCALGLIIKSYQLRELDKKCGNYQKYQDALLKYEHLREQYLSMRKEFE